MTVSDTTSLSVYPVWREEKVRCRMAVSLPPFEDTLSFSHFLERRKMAEIELSRVVVHIAVYSFLSPNGKSETDKEIESEVKEKRKKRRSSQVETTTENENTQKKDDVKWKKVKKGETKREKRITSTLYKIQEMEVEDGKEDPNVQYFLSDLCYISSFPTSF